MIDYVEREKGRESKERESEMERERGSVREKWGEREGKRERGRGRRWQNEKLRLEDCPLRRDDNSEGARCCYSSC